MFSASFSCVKWFFLKKNQSLQGRPGGRWRRLSKDPVSPCQPGFSAILQIGNPRLPGRTKPSGEAREASPFSFPTIRSKARNLTEDPLGSKNETFLFSLWSRRTLVPAAPASGPFPSEAGIYAAPLLSATGIRTFCEVSRRVPVDEALVRSLSQRLYRFSGIPPRAWPRRSDTSLRLRWRSLRPVAPPAARADAGFVGLSSAP